MKLSQIKTKLKQEPLLFLLPVIGIIFIGQAFLQHNILQADPKNDSFIWIIELLGFLVIGLLVWSVFRYLTKSIKSFSYYMEDMASGNIERSGKFKADKNDIWARMADSLNRFSDHYREKIHFVSEIAEGNTEVSLQQEDENDHLAQALLKVRDSLKEAKEERERREIEEKKRRWVNEGIAKFADLIRRNHENLEELSYSIISELIQYLGANQGGLFLLNDHDQEDPVFELKAAYAFNRRKYLTKQIKFGEGLVGTCALEREYIYMTEIPQDYIKITSGLGDANPDSLLIVPLQTDEQVEGVIEIASFGKLESYQIEFVRKVAESIASTISSTKINMKTNQLLQKSQQQAEEMASQEEEMRQNMEEMEATQEELSRKMKANEEMHQQLLQEKALLDAVMNNLPDYIYFKDKDSKFIRVSKSMLPLFPVDTIEDMIGKSDFDFHQEDAAREMYAEEQEIIRKEQGFQNKIQHEVTETGKDQWVSVTKLPLYDPEGNLMGTFGISKDVTQFKKLEMELKNKKGNN